MDRQSRITELVMLMNRALEEGDNAAFSLYDAEHKRLCDLRNSYEVVQRTGSEPEDAVLARLHQMEPKELVQYIETWRFRVRKQTKLARDKRASLAETEQALFKNTRNLAAAKRILRELEDAETSSQES